MAHPGELVRTLADVLGIGASTVAQQDRLLAQANIRRKSGRGRSAALMTAKDAASLLVAVVAPPIIGPQVRETVETFHAFSDLKAHLTEELYDSDVIPSELGDWSNLAILRDLPRGHSLLA